MTQTLKTDRLKALRDELAEFKSCFDPVADETNHCMFSDAVIAVDALLANRDAQPVGFYATVSGRKGVVWHNGAPEDDTAIYTAPPAPVVNPEFTGAPAMPDERAAFNAWNNEDNLPIAGIPAKNAAWLAWQARAMLAQPVSQECKLNSPETPDGWIACRDRMPNKGQCVSITDGSLVGVWRYRGWWPDCDGNGCASTSNPFLLIRYVTHWMPLPAAPEGGN